LPTTSHAAPRVDVLSLLQASAADHERAVALHPLGCDSVTYRSLLLRVTALVDSLRACGVSGGENASRVAIVMANGPDLSIALLGSCCAGVAVPFNPAYRAEEYETYFTRTRVDFLLVASEETGPAVTVARQLGIRLLRLGLEVARVDEDPAGSMPSICAPNGEDLALIMLTSGSTGGGKIVPLSHRNLCTSSHEVCRSLELGPGDRCLSMWQQFHIGGVVDLLLAPLASGGRIISAGGFDAARFFELLAVAEPTWFQGVPTTLRELCHHAKAHQIDTLGSSLRFIRSVAAALPAAWMQEIEQRFGVPVIQTFGMTEAAPLVTSNRLPPGQRKPESAGISCGASVRIMDDHGRPLSTGERGPIAIQGDNVFAGYEGEPQANVDSFRDGWFYTGDVGYLDADGYLFLTGRVKEIINRGGEKISPEEIDHALLLHPAIAQAAAFGLTHPTLGEEVAAAVVLEPGLTTTQVDLQDFVAQRLAAFKVPRHVSFLSELPRCPVGKVRRRELADLALAERSSAPRCAPRNPLETKLMELWASELDLDPDCFGIDDDFTELGGDSLSSVRILVAVQAMFGVKIPDHAVASFDTVRNMAAELNGMGLSADSLPGSLSAPDPDRAAKFSVEHSIAAATETLLGENDAARFALYGCRTVAEFEVLRHSRESISTPAELHALLDQKPPLISRWHVADLFRLKTARKIARRRRRMSRRFFRDYVSADRPMAWTRRNIGQSAYLFSAAPEEPPAKTLVVGFTGNSMRLMMPTYRLLFCIDPARTDLLLVMDPERKHYRFGVPDLGDTLEATARRLDEYARSEGYLRVVAIGTSGGGLAAICAGIINRWSKVLALGPDRPSRHAHCSETIERLQSALAEPTAPAVTVAYSAQNRRDSESALEIAGMIPSATLLPDHRFRQHGIIHALYQAGELKEFLRKQLV
jgi:acyl-CoA synthetase (AMP-forming)/AMP-acid ligase II/acyl carrier protein